MQGFFQATRVPNGLVAPNGDLISQAGWENACERFHRQHTVTAQRCQESNQLLMEQSQQGKVCGNCCHNGLMDYATPIVIEGEKLATLFLGQVFHQPPDLAFFRQQAKQFGFDEQAYIQSISEVPVISEEEIKSVMGCMLSIAEVLVQSGLAKYRETTLKKHTEAIERSLSQHKKRQIQLEDILNSSPVAIGWSDADGNVEYINQQFTQTFGYTIDEVPTVQRWYELAYPDEHYRKTVIIPWFEHSKRNRDNAKRVDNLEVNIVCKNGSTRRVLLHVTWAGSKRLVNFSDITNHWLSEQRNIARDAILEMIVNNTPLTTILYALVTEIESEAPSTLCSILLLDENGEHFNHVTAPSLPEEYNQAVNGVEIGPGVGSCGTAAYLGERVVVEDVTTHEYWENYTQLAEMAGIRSCWSEPIIATNGKILGTFAIYHKQPASPTQDDIERISFAANLASIAIENRHNHDELERRAYYDHLTGLANRRYFIECAHNEIIRSSRHDNDLSLIMMDIDYFKQVNDNFGHNVGDLVLKKLAEVSQSTLRTIDLISRIGGEEFAILLPQTDPVQAIDIAERLRLAIAAINITVSEKVSIQFTVSLGITSYDHHQTTNIDILLNQADQALYQAKNQGRNRICTYTEPNH